MEDSTEKITSTEVRYFRYWGKARKKEEGEGSGVLYHLLPYHCLDVAAESNCRPMQAECCPRIDIYRGGSR